MSLIEVLLIGLVLLIGIGWQVYLLFEKDAWREAFGGDADEWPRRMHVPLIIGALVFLGCSGRGVAHLLDPRSHDYNFWDLLLTIVKSLAFAIGINLKAVFGPLLLSIYFTACLYYWFEYSELHANPIEFISALLKLVVEPCPQWAKYAYAIATGLYAFGGALHDSIFPDH